MFAYFLFDWDGCLVPSMPLWLKSYRKTFKKYGVKIPSKEIVEKVMGNLHAPIDVGVPKKDIEVFYESLINNFNSLYANLDLLSEGALDILKFLKEKDKKISIVTSSSHSVLDPIIDKFNLGKYIDFVVAWEDVSKLKPDPEPILRALGKYKAKKEEAVMVGDSAKDIIAGKKAGTKTVLYFPKDHNKYYSFEELKSLKPDYIISSFEGLQNLC